MASAKSAVCFLSLAAMASVQTYALRSARIFDSATGKVSVPGLIVVANGKIQALGGTVPAGAEVIELGDATLMPGFIDAHTHLTMDFDADYNGAMLKGLQTTIAEKSIRATVNARKTLMAGFTTRSGSSTGLSHLEKGLKRLRSTG
jgi:imidazolonepropionase-like amidohydrolase